MNGKIIRCLAIAVGLLLYGAAFYLYDNFTNMPNIIYVADGNFYSVKCCEPLSTAAQPLSPFRRQHGVRGTN